MATLYLIRGLPGSGKSTLADSMYASNMVDAVYSADDYFTDIATGEYKFHPSGLSIAHAECQHLTQLALATGATVAVANTSTTEKEVETYRKIAEECGARFVSIIVENRHGGKNIHYVPEEKIQQMRNRFSVKL